MTAHRYWQISCLTNGQSNVNFAIAEVSLASSYGGANLCGSGTASASTIYNSSYQASDAFDGNESTMWSSGPSSTPAGPPQNLTYDFGSGNAYSIVEVKITSRSDGYAVSTPSTFSLQYSDNNSTWTTLQTFTAATWGLDQTQIFDYSPTPITIRGTSSTGYTNGSSAPGYIPSGTTTGDVTFIEIVQCATSSPQILTGPAGWTVIAQASNFMIVYRVWQTGDPGSVTFTSNGSNYWNSASISYTGLDTITPVDTYNQCINYGFGDGIRAPSVNPSYMYDKLLVGYMQSESGAGGSLTLMGGLVAEVYNISGPNILFADLQLTDGTPTGNLDGYWEQSGVYQIGVQIALKAAGATAAVTAPPRPTFGSMVFAENGYGTGSIGYDLLALGVQENDLVCVFINEPYSVIPQSGYSAASGNLNGAELFTHQWKTGDATTIYFPLSEPAYSFGACIILRTNGVGGIPSFVGGSVGTTASTTVVSGSLTPAGASDLLIVWFGENDSGADGTWTLPAGLTSDYNYASNGNSVIFAWKYPSPVPTGSYTATLSTPAQLGALATVFGSAILSGHTQPQLIMVM